MRWGVALTTYKPKHWSQEVVFRNSLVMANAAERLGFDDVWLLEHHFIEYGLCPDGLVMAGFLLGATKRIKVGTAVTVAPLNHPVRLIEQTSLLDQLSGGRFLPGFGRGFYPLDFKILGADPSRSHETLQEWVQILLTAWKQDGKISWKSDLIEIPEITVYPAKLTKPRPPVYIVGESPSTIEWAARLGLPLIMNVPQSFGQTKAKLDLYGEIAELHGHDPSTIGHMISAVVHIADTRETAMSECLRNLERWHEDSINAAFTVDDLRKLPNYRFHWSQLQDAILKGESDPAIVVRRALEISPVGTVADCIEAFNQLREKTGVKHFMCGFEGSFNMERIMESMQRFSEEVIPKL